MSEIHNEAYTEARQEIEKLRLDNSELIEEMLFFTGLAGQMHKMDARIKQLKFLLNRAADALESGSSENVFPINPGTAQGYKVNYRHLKCRTIRRKSQIRL